MGAEATIVHVEPWLFHSPDLALVGRKVDVGLLAEALVFYERVYFAFTSDEQFARVIAWFQSQGRTADLIALLRDRTLVPYYYAFVTLPGHKDGIWSIMNLQDEEQAHQPVFETRILRSGMLNSLVRRASLRDQLNDAAMANHREVKADAFGAALANARVDYSDPDRAAFLVQTVYDELYPALGLPSAPRIIAQRTEPAPGLQTLTWNRDFREFKQKLGANAAFHPGTPLAAAGFGVKALWSAAQLGSDLYLGAPASMYARFKLEEGNKATRTRAVIEELVEEASFPNIRDLVNRNQIDVAAVLRLRAKGSRFRNWLRSESQFDRNAVVAYLGELAVESGWTRDVKSVVRAVGLFGGAAAGAMLAGPLGVVGGALAGAGVQFVSDIAGKLDSGWRPKVFGQVALAEISKAAKRRRGQ